MAISNHRSVTRAAQAAVLSASAVFILLAAPAKGQPPQPPRAAAPQKEELSLVTKDGVLLKATYYPSTEGKDAVPVVLLHDHKGSRHELAVYAEFLQKPEPRPDGPPFTSLAVIVPDLRGHGGSTQQQIAGRTIELDASRLNRRDFANMLLDMEAVRKFLLEQNDEGQLNLNKLVVVGAGMGATVGLHWTARDWSMPPLATGKQGQDVKAVALVSPEWSFQGVSIQPAINHPLVRSQVDFLVAFGERESSRERDAERIYKIAERFHPPYDPSQGADKQEVFLLPRETTQQGGELLIRDPAVGFAIRDFIESRAVKQDFPWTERKID